MLSAAAQEAGKLLDEVKSFEEQFAAFSAQLEEAGVRILVIVDDLDRLDANELLTVLKTVRLLGSFPGIHYLLAYDHATIRDVLSNSAVAGGKAQRALEYIEKIIQYPFELPPLQPAHRYRELAEGVASAAGNAGIDFETLAIDNLQVVQAFLDQVPDSDLLTLRSIHRLVHQFDVTLTIIGPTDVSFIDLLLLTFLRVTYPVLYRRLTDWKVDLTKPAHANNFGGRKSDVVDWSERVNAVLPEGISDKDALQIRALLRYLFPVIPDVTGNPLFGRHDLDHRRVFEREYFDRYFAFGVTDGQISDATVFDGLSALALQGSLPVGHEFRKALGDYRSRHALKASHMLVLDAPFTSESAFSSARWLTSMFDLPTSHAPIRTPQARLVADLLAIAVERASTGEVASALIDKYNEEFGLDLTTMVIASIEDDLEARARHPYDKTRRQAALQNHRERQLQACIRDLEDDIFPGEGGVLFHCNALDATTFDRLRRWVRDKVKTWGDLIEVAGRYEGVWERDGDYTLSRFCFDEFRDLIDIPEWPALEGDIDFECAIDEADVTLANRVRVAEVVLAKAYREYELQLASGVKYNWQGRHG